MELLTAGKMICDKRLFGPANNNNRYAIAPVYTRFGTVQWFVWDAEVYDYDNNNRATLIRQADTIAEAVEGLLGLEARVDLEFFYR